ncbi:MAG TPA: FixH family protein [Micropepsaceae bacterium]|jgi:nitrogen fixation protein FixH|nr:FixH family protein [Micropepsaceae bacterium]
MKSALTGRHVLFWLLGSFAVVFAFNATFVVLSVKTFRGEDEQRPYLQGIGYNETLERRAGQKKMGWTATIGATRLDTGKVRIAVDLKGKDGLPVRHMPLAGILRHPSDETRDHALEFHETGDGTFVAEVSDVTAGSWDVLVSTTNNSGSPFEGSRRLWVP